MTITAWRICRDASRELAFSGAGACEWRGRWNSPGTSAVYAASNPAAAVLEVLVHMENAQVLDEYYLWPVKFDEELVEEIDFSALPRDWRSHPPPLAVQRIGDAWIDGDSSPILRVAGAIIDVELEIQCNYMLNPGHRRFREVEIGSVRPFIFDARLAGTTD